MSDDEHSGAVRVAVPKIELPEFVPPTPEELERRQKLFGEIMRLRQEMKPLGISVSELIREHREGEDTIDGWGPSLRGRCLSRREMVSAR